MRVFEYGSGPSTLWWAARAATVTAVVHEHKLVERLTPSLPPNASLVEVPFAAGDPGYARAPREAGDLFDVIAVGGRDRGTCAVECLPALRDDGVVVLNHSNRRQYVPAHEALAAKGFRRIELTGHGPVDGSTWRTTVFYRPANCFGI